MGGLGMRELVIVALIVLVFLWPWSKILRKAGYSGWFCLLAPVPLVNIIALWIFAVADWPSLRRVGETTR